MGNVGINIHPTDADTLDGLHVNEITSNPNLLDNPDFKINQRGLSEYTEKGYTVDRWYMDQRNGETSLSIGDDGITFSVTNSTGWNEIRQLIAPDVVKSLSGKTITMSAMIDGTLYYGTAYNFDPYTNYTPILIIASEPNEFHIDLRNNVTSTIPINLYIRIGCEADIIISNIEWVKLELGSIPTAFTPPNPVEELLKIQSMNDDGGSKLISNDLLPTMVNSQMISNPNLLDNPDFKINQRGQGEYILSGSSTMMTKYTVDRWWIYISSGTTEGDFTLTPSSSGGLSVSNQTNSNGAALVQKIENYTDLFGKQVTFSASIDGTIMSVTATISNTTNELAKLTTDFGYLRVYAQQDKRVEFEFYINKGASINIDWAKVETGTITTPFVPPNPATELVKCQRYLLKLNGDLPTGMIYSTNGIWFLIPGFNMRTTPSIEKNNLGIKATHGSDGTVITDGLSWSVDVAKESGVVLRMTKTNHGYTDVTLHGGTGDNFTLLSADI